MNYDLNKMTPKELKSLIEFIGNILNITIKDKKTVSRVINQEVDKLECPFCNSESIIKSGFTKTQIQRYKCKECGRRFGDTSNSVCYHSKLTYSIWSSFFECMSDKLSIRKTAKKIGVNKNTAFAMRHKVLNALSVFRELVKLEGEVQVDETSIPINFKGSSQSEMPRSSKKRKSASKLLNHKVCILGAIDEVDNEYLEIVDYGEITSNDIENSLGPRIKKATCLVTDCRSSYEKVAKDHNLKLEQVKSKTYKNEDGYTLSEINGLHSNFFGFLSSFKGVSTKHLQGYIDWFVYKKYIDYTVEIIKHPEVLLNYSFSQKRSITINEIYNKELPFDVNEAYSDYLSTPSI